MKRKMNIKIEEKYILYFEKIEDIVKIENLY